MTRKQDTQVVTVTRNDDSAVRVNHGHAAGHTAYTYRLAVNGRVTDGRLTLDWLAMMAHEPGWEASIADACKAMWESETSRIYREERSL